MLNKSINSNVISFMIIIAIYMYIIRGYCLLESFAFAAFDDLMSLIRDAD